MAATVGGGIRDLVVADGLLGARFWSDSAPDGATFPYGTFHDGISMAPALKGDARTLRLVRQVQVDLWERQRDEDEDVARALYALLDGALITVGQDRMRLAVDDAQRFVEADTSIVHRALTLAVRHDPAAF